MIQPWQVAGCLLVQPAFGGGDFTVLFGVIILRRDEPRAQGDGVSLAGSDDHRGDGAIGAKISGLSVEKFCIWSKKLMFFRKTIEF